MALHCKTPSLARRAEPLGLTLEAICSISLLLEFIEFGIDLWGLEQPSYREPFARRRLVRRCGGCRRERIGLLIDGRSEFFIDRVGILAGFHPLDRFEHRTGRFPAGEFEHPLHQVGHLFGIFLTAFVLHARSHLAHELLELRLIDVGKRVGGIALAVFEQAFGNCEA